MRIGLSSRRSPSGAGVSTPGKLFGCLFFGMFLAGGLFFAVMLLGAVLAELQTFLWKATPCEILASSVETETDDSGSYRPAIRYRYTYEARDYESSRVSRRGSASDDYADVSELVASYPVGAAATCYVDPSEPRQAVLERTLPWFGLFLVIPLIFIAVGGGGVWMTWRARSRSATAGAQPREAISTRAGGNDKTFWFLLVFGGIFTAVGAGVFLGMAVIPMARLWAAQSWLEVPCTVISSAVRSHSSDDGTTYSIDILYEYELEQADGPVTYRSNRYDFMGWSSSGYDSKREVVDAYPPGSKATCFVDPDRPARAVLDRSLRLAYLVGLFPLIFLVVGLAIMRWAFVQRRTRAASAGLSPGLAPVPTATLHGGSGMVGLPGAAVSPTGSIELKPAHSPAVKLIGSIAFALLWNGIVSVFLWQLIGDFADGDGSWFMALFLTPFVLVGLGAIGMIVYYALAMVNPRPHLVMTPAAPRLGESVSLTWRMVGAVGRLQRLEIKLEGREEATYRRGTTTHTDRETFAELGMADCRTAIEIAAGSARLTIPADTMHSFASTHNKVAWAIKVRGDIPRWPDVNEEYPITVRPAVPEV